MEIINILPGIITAVISGAAAYFTATKKSKTDLETLCVTNKADIEKLMSQHKLDLEALERKHEMEMEKMELDHSHKLELQQKDWESQFSSSMISEAMKLPEFRQAIGQGVQQGKKRK